VTGGRQTIAPVERILHLRAMPAFERLPQVLLGAVAQRTNERPFHQGSIMIDPEHPIAATYVVVDGKVATSSVGGPTIVSGESVGFLEFLARLDGGVEAQAATEVLTLEIDYDSHLELCDEHFAILHAHLQYLGEQIANRVHRPDSSARPLVTQVRNSPGDRGLDLVQRVLALGGYEAFASTSADALVELARHATEVDYATGDVIWRLGDEAVDFLLLTAGRVSCQPAVGNSWTAKPTLALGLHDALAELPRVYGTTAQSDVTGLKLPMEPVLDVLEDHLELGMGLMSRLARELLDYSRALE